MDCLHRVSSFNKYPMTQHGLGIITSLVEIYSSETSNICPVRVSNHRLYMIES